MTVAKKYSIEKSATQYVNCSCWIVYVFMGWDTVFSKN